MNQAVPPGATERKRAPPFYLQLWFLVLVAMALGVTLGHFYPSFHPGHFGIGKLLLDDCFRRPCILRLRFRPL
jgi:hypothetical protein